MTKYEGNFDVNSLHTLFVEVFSKINKFQLEIEVECNYGISMIFYKISRESLVNISVIEDDIVLYHTEFSTFNKDYWKLAEETNNFLKKINVF